MLNEDLDATLTRLRHADDDIQALAVATRAKATRLRNITTSYEDGLIDDIDAQIARVQERLEFLQSKRAQAQGYISDGNKLAAATEALAATREQEAAEFSAARAAVAERAEAARFKAADIGALMEEAGGLLRRYAFTPTAAIADAEVRRRAEAWALQQKLYDAIESRDAPAVEALLAAGAEANGFCSEGSSLLLRACMKRSALGERVSSGLLTTEARQLRDTASTIIDALIDAGAETKSLFESSFKCHVDHKRLGLTSVTKIFGEHSEEAKE